MFHQYSLCQAQRLDGYKCNIPDSFISQIMDMKVELTGSVLTYWASYYVQYCPRYPPLKYLFPRIQNTSCGQNSPFFNAHYMEGTYIIMRLSSIGQAHHHYPSPYSFFLCTQTASAKHSFHRHVHSIMRGLREGLLSWYWAHPIKRIFV